MQVMPPPLPPWEGMHPLLVHFPIALLMVAPIFVLLGILIPRKGFSVAALLLMVLGVASAWMATSSGEAAHGVMDQTMSMDDWELYEKADFAAQAHGEQTELARNVFTGLTLLYAVVLAMGKLSTGWKARVIPQLAVMLAWAPSLGYLANAAHTGGELVHRFGVRAILPEEESQEDEADDEAEGDLDEPSPTNEESDEASSTEAPSTDGAPNVQESPDETIPADEDEPRVEPSA